MSTQKVLNFMGVRIAASALSVILLVVSIAALAVNGLKLGLDFTGGAQVEVSFSEPADIPQIRTLLDEQGLQNPVAVLFGSDTEVLIRSQGAMSDGGKTALDRRLAAEDAEASVLSIDRAEREAGGFSSAIVIATNNPDAIDFGTVFPAAYFGQVQPQAGGGQLTVLTENNLDTAYTAELIDVLAERTGSQVELRRSEYVGPQIGAELRDEGGLGMLVALIVVMFYVMVRFQYKFSLGAVLALIHDVVLVLGFFAVLQLDFDLTVLAAILAVIGYSLNDTIVVFDRIRENFRKVRKATPTEIVNISLTQSLERTLITSLTTLLVLVMLYVFGGELISGFAIALIVGIVVGTYSSIYVSANTLMWLGICKEDLMPPEKEGAEVDEMP